MMFGFLGLIINNSGKNDELHFKCKIKRYFINITNYCFLFLSGITFLPVLNVLLCPSV
ncbi:hypothetical protein ATN83_1165 [Raoultella ornithinolytica]|nr:hypothetical protein ATN83_1165 [Raoultella ornithinolytica]